ncbi:S8 family serine peptidase [Paractinoplanes atraurantiacus]|uniref:Serine protease, subtilisin family n=1 Tax=Paractinoplanes atraurantiacus TaxID=1036182 RepID=A0A285J2E4_9ACTN|nr:S8 family serine peptidase [Actinoplanes atraurantiacus]SNY53536.1 Serine protease, subtilisin family [Actinoplanes atraurantiacus]
MRRRIWAAALAALLAAGTVAVDKASAATPTAGRQDFTLITGDRVVRSGDHLAVDRAPGREQVTFVERGDGKHRYVFPSDALPLVQAGRLDRRLFDLTTLAAFGYTGSHDLPLLIKGAATLKATEVVASLPALDMVAVRADREQRAGLWAGLTAGAEARRTLRGVDQIWLDGKRKLDLDHSVPQIGAPAAWQKGLDGSGVSIAVLDSGVDATHPDLAGRLKEVRNFTDAPDADDTVGHGTHVASTIAGTGAASGGRYRGVAPGAQLLIGKVCPSEECQDSAILAGMAWAAAGAPVVNMSLGADDEPGIDPLEEAVDELSARYHTLFVVAAGNDGHAPVSSPGSAPGALSVGAVDRDNAIADFSNWGPAREGDLIKPEITAPGVDIVAAKAAHATIGDPAENPAYSSLSGTSMATPHVTGAAAILAQQHPGWTGQQLKTALMASAEPTPDLETYAQGAGRVDVARAITQTVATETGSVDFGTVPFPHTNDKPLGRTVTFRNDGTTPVTLRLAVETTAPAGMFTADQPSLTVAAGATATAKLTADTTVETDQQWIGGRIVATAADGVRVEVPFGVHREGPAYTVTLRHTGHDGAAPVTQFTGFTDLTTFAYAEAAGSTIRLPAGTYGISGLVNSGDGSTSLLVQPRLVLDRDLTVDLDARQAKPVAVSVPDRKAATTFTSIRGTWISPEGVFTDAAIYGPGAGLTFAEIGDHRAEPQFHSAITTTLTTPTSSFRLHWPRDGRFPTGVAKAYQRKDLAAIAGTYARSAGGAPGMVGFTAVSRRDGQLIETGYSPDTQIAMPATRTDFVNTDNGILWTAGFGEYDVDSDAYLGFAQRSPFPYRPGQTYHLAWNKAVFAPSAAHGSVTREGNEITVDLPSYVDASGVRVNGVTARPRTITLYRAGKAIGTIDENAEQPRQFTVPAAAAAYRMTATAKRTAPYELSTAVTSTWTFRSGSTTTATPLPLLTVRMSPALNLGNSAPRARQFAVPLTFESQPGAKPGLITAVTAQISYDDGKTWKNATVQGQGASRTAWVRHPLKAGFASLRVSAHTTTGNTVEQTIIRAYRIS